MKRKHPFYNELISYESDFLSRNSHNIFKQQPSITKFNSSNEDCKEYLYIPQLLKADMFPEILQNVPLFLLDSNISVGVSASKPIMCNLLHGSPLTANTLFGMDIGRFSHISEVEHTNIKICHVTEQCAKTIFNVKAEIFIAIRSNEIFINDKSCEFINEGDEESLKTGKILINDHYSVEIELKFETDQDETKANPIAFLTLFENEDQNLSQSTQPNTINQTSFLIESEIPLNIDFYEDRDEESECCDDYCQISTEIIRIVAPELVIESSIQTTFCDFLIASKLTINNRIECKKSFIIRANDLSIESTIETDELLIISSNTVFSNYSSLQTSNLCAIFANTSFQCESSKIKLSKNTFIKSRNINFHSKKQASSTSGPNLEIKTKIENENESEVESENEEEVENEEETVPNNCFIQAEKVNIGPNFSIKADENFSIECSSLEVSNRKASIEIGEKLYLLFVVNKTSQKIGSNNGVIKCNNLFFEVDSEDSSPVNDYVFQTTNAFTVGTAFLLSSGTFENTGNVLFGAFYVSAYSRFKNSSENSSFKIGDFLVIESDAVFSNEGKMKAVFKPTILNSGKMTFSYHKEKKTENKGRGRKKGDNFLLKSSEEKKSNFSFICNKFVTNGHIEGDYFSVIADDVISIAGTMNCREIDLEANKISIISLFTIRTFKASFRALWVEIKKGLIKAANFLNYCDQKNSEIESEEEKEKFLQSDEKIQDSSIDIFYQNKFVGEINRIKCFDKIQVVQISNFRNDTDEDKNKTEKSRKSIKKK